jgi:adenosylcobinamide-GDP ribazoletransferase
MAASRRADHHDRPAGGRWHALYPLLAALQFLTLVPPVVRRRFTVDEMGRAVGFFPLVGLLLGALLAVVDLGGLVLLFPDGVVAALLLGVWVVATGALHLDGFLDTCDGLFGGYDHQTRLDIMRDERVGAFALAGGVLLLLTKYASLAALPDRTAALLLAPVLGRWSMSLAVVGFSYARPAGLGRAMKDRAGARQALLATGLALAVAGSVARAWGLVALAVAGATVALGARFVMARLPGLTGDVYGALCELSEVAVLLLLVAAS